MILSNLLEFESIRILFLVQFKATGVTVTEMEDSLHFIKINRPHVKQDGELVLNVRRCCGHVTDYHTHPRIATMATSRLQGASRVIEPVSDVFKIQVQDREGEFVDAVVLRPRHRGEGEEDDR